MTCVKTNQRFISLKPAHPLPSCSCQCLEFRVKGAFMILMMRRLILYDVPISKARYGHISWSWRCACGLCSTCRAGGALSSLGHSLAFKHRKINPCSHISCFVFWRRGAAVAISFRVMLFRTKLATPDTFGCVGAWRQTPGPWRQCTLTWFVKMTMVSTADTQISQNS